MAGLLARSEVEVDAPLDRVWAALTEPDQIQQYMGATVETDWQPGSPITWTGEWEGKSFRDEGEVVEVLPNERLVLRHRSGTAAEGSDSHTITYLLTDHDGHTDVALTQDNNRTQDEADHSAKNWSMMLQGLKKSVESG